MPLLGGAAVLIWNDITPEGRDEFYAWHNTEHMPERTAIPGFLRGRRYGAEDAATAPEFFTLYEVATPAVLTGADYLARLNAPTEWTRRATQAFRNTSRALTQVIHSDSIGAGGLMGTVRLPVRLALDEARIASAIEDPLITGFHLCATNEAASAERTNESRGRTDIRAAPILTILIEGCGLDAVVEALARLRAAVIPHEKDATIGVYRLEYECRRER